MAIWTQKPPVGSQINWGHPLSQGLVGAWLMNEGGGNVIKDIATINTGGLVSGSWKPTTKGLGINFDGTATQVNCGHSQQLDVTTKPLTYAFTFQTSYTAGVSKFIVSKGTTEVISTSNAGIIFKTDFLTTDLSRQSAVSWFSINIPYIITLTWDGSPVATGIHIYKDGVESPSYTSINAVDGKVDTSANDFIIGDSANRVSQVMNFLMRWNRVLSPSEISSLYTSPYQFITAPRSRFYSIPTTIRKRQLASLGVGI